jgi:hypothetical protein
MYSQSKKIGKPNNLKVFGNKVINAPGRSTLVFTNYFNKEHYISNIKKIKKYSFY